MKPYYIAPLPMFHLNRACRYINKSVDGFGCFLVGSCLERRDHRDVDVRCIVTDEYFDRVFPTDQAWSLFCVAVSSWLAQQTGLQVDFQVQRQSHANAAHPHKRNAIGFDDYPGELPSVQRGPKALEGGKDAGGVVVLRLPGDPPGPACCRFVAADGSVYDLEPRTGRRIATGLVLTGPELAAVLEGGK